MDGIHAKTITPVHRTLTLADGQEVGLTLNFALLHRLSVEDPQTYQVFFRVYSGDKRVKVDPLFDSIRIIYAAYRCWCVASGAGEWMSWEDFLLALPEDIEGALTLSTELISAKKRTASAGPASTEAAAPAAE